MYTQGMRRGVTVAEIVVGMALLAILGGIVLIAINPFGQVAGARNTQRNLHIQAIMNSVRQNIAESGTNTFECTSGDIPATPTQMRATSGYDIAPCIVPDFLTALPFDPQLAGANFTSIGAYDTGYLISRASSTGQVTISAPGAELGATISLTR
jgi:type II secretory pathway pseudopilin PulG